MNKKKIIFSIILSIFSFFTPSNGVKPSESQKHLCLQDMPFEVLHNILSFLPKKDVLAIAQSCKIAAHYSIKQKVFNLEYINLHKGKEVSKYDNIKYSLSIIKKYILVNHYIRDIPCEVKFDHDAAKKPCFLDVIEDIKNNFKKRRITFKIQDLLFAYKYESALKILCNEKGSKISLRLIGPDYFRKLLPQVGLPSYFKNLRSPYLPHVTELSWITGLCSRFNDYITELNLEGNKIRISEIKNIVKILGPDSSIRTLNLKSGDIYDDVVLEIVGMLSTNTSLTELNLESNNITDISASWLREELRQGICKIKSLNLKKNYISANELSRLRADLIHLESLNLENNPVPLSLIESFVNLLSEPLVGLALLEGV